MNCCNDPLIRYNDGPFCANCEPEKLAACPVCRQRPPFGDDHAHSGAEMLRGVS